MSEILPGLQRLQGHLGECLLPYGLHTEKGFIGNTDQAEEAGQTSWPSLTIRQLANSNIGYIPRM